MHVSPSFILKRKYALRKKLKCPIMDDEDAGYCEAVRDELKFLTELLNTYGLSEKRKSNSCT
jgi:hypothetical protein